MSEVTDWANARYGFESNGRTKPSDWPAIIRFSEPDLPPFPTSVLPDSLRDFVSATAKATQTPPDLAAMLALAVCGACLARRITFKPRPEPDCDWIEPSNLFAAILLTPGNRKSAVYDAATRPLRELEKELVLRDHERFELEIAEYRVKKSRLTRLEKLAAEAAKKEDRDAAYKELMELAAEYAHLVEPQELRLLADNITAEMLESMICQQDGRMACMSDEGGIFDVISGRYTGGVATLDVYLKGHCGGTISTDRLCRARISVDRAALTCVYAIQPSVIAGLGKTMRDRGLLARFLYAAPASPVGDRDTRPEPAPTAVKICYARTIRRLFDSANQVAGDGETIVFSAAAAEALDVWAKEVEFMLRDGEAMDGFKDWGSKLVGATVRLAGILHAIEYGIHDGVDHRSVTAAIAIARYLIPHAGHVLLDTRVAESPEIEGARWVAGWITRKQVRQFSLRHVHQDGRRRFVSSDAVRECLRLLEDRNYIRRSPSDDSPGRKPENFEVHPDF